MVRIQQHGGRAGRRGPPAEHRRLAACHGEHVDLGQASLSQQGGDLIGAGPHLRGGRRICRH